MRRGCMSLGRPIAYMKIALSDAKKKCLYTQAAGGWEAKKIAVQANATK